jgi:hypothetical protein
MTQDQPALPTEAPPARTPGALVFMELSFDADADVQFDTFLAAFQQRFASRFILNPEKVEDAVSIANTVNCQILDETLFETRPQTTTKLSVAHLRIIDNFVKENGTKR